MIIAFVPCRLKSSRLPSKALKLIYGIPAIERCLINTLSIPGVDKVVLATSTNEEDDALERFNVGGKVDIVRGSEDDVLSRFMPSIDKYNPNSIIRVTGDCPFVSAELGEMLIESHLKNDADATYTLSKVALGISFEIYKTSAVRRLRELFINTNYSEYLIYYFQNNPNYFKLNSVEAPSKFVKPWRLTLDEENDLELFELIFSTLDLKDEAVTFDDVVAFFDKNPDAQNININNKVKYRQDLELIETLKKATTYSV